MITENTYSVVSGTYELTSSQLAYRKIYMIAREGKIHTFVTTNDDVVLLDLQAKYSPAFGSIYFDIPFNTGEKITVVYED